MRAVAIQSDGKIIVAVTLVIGKKTPFGLARYNPDGSVDSTFGKGGRQITDTGNENFIRSIAIQNDGKIVLAGFTRTSNFPSPQNYNLLLARYNSNGLLDENFSAGGIIISDYSLEDRLNSVAIQTDGKIVVTGTINNDFAVLRYKNNGSPDSTFSGDGKLTTDYGKLGDEANAVVIQKDGKIIVAGTSDRGNYIDMAVSRYSTGGSPDNTFSTDGKQLIHFEENANRTSYAYAAAVDSNDNIVVAGYGLVRLKKDGTFDSTFHYDGKVSTDVITSIVITGGKLYATGSISGTMQGFIASYFLNGKNGPAVFLTSPLNNTSFVAGATIKLMAAAWATGDTISKIEFYNGTTLLNIVSDTPYVYQWSDVPKGNYTLTAKGTNVSGTFTISAPVHISVVSAEPPVVKITVPLRDTNFIVSQPVRLTAEASEPGGTIRSVDFYNGSTLIFSDPTPPYSGIWDSIPTGSYHITAIATDNEGLKSTSAPVHITILHNRLPQVNITSPVSGTIYNAPPTILLSADAKPHGGKITTVDFYNGTTLIHTEENPPYLWNWKGVPAGTYSITAKATDTYMRTVESAPVTITVVPAHAAPVSRRGDGEYNVTRINTDVKLAVTPNPATSSLIIHITGVKRNKPSTVYVLSASGTTIQTRQLNTSTQTIHLDISTLSAGIYTIKLSTGDSVFYKRFVKSE